MKTQVDIKVHAEPMVIHVPKDMYKVTIYYEHGDADLNTEQVFMYLPVRAGDLQKLHEDLAVLSIMNTDEFRDLNSSTLEGMLIKKFLESEGDFTRTEDQLIGRFFANDKIHDGNAKVVDVIVQYYNPEGVLYEVDVLVDDEPL